MGETKKGTKKSVSPNPGQAISKRILVAEDNKTTQDLVSRFLEFLGFELTLAGNGIEALAIFIEGSFDLVLNWKIFKGAAKERWRPESENMEAWGAGTVLAFLRRTGNRAVAFAEGRGSSIVMTALLTNEFVIMA